MQRIPAFKLVAEPLESVPVDLSGFELAPDDVGNRHKLGGEPDWLQKGSSSPRCSCGEEMSFYAQLDTIGLDFALADCGLIYVFVCFDCFQTKSLLQSY